MASSIGNIAITFSANTAAFLQGLGLVSKNSKLVSKKITADFAAAGKTIAKIGNTSMKAFGAALAGVSVGVIKASMDINKLVDEANKMNMTASSLQQLQYAFSTMGISVEKAKTSIEDIQKATIRATEGNRKARESFAALGISFTRLSTLEADKQLLIIADALNKINDPIERSRIGIDLLGQSYTELTSFISGGSEQFSKLAMESARIGQSLSQIDLENIKNMTTQFALAKDSATGVFNVLSSAIAPIAGQILTTFNEWLRTANNFRSIVLNIVNGFGTVLLIAGQIVDAITAFVRVGQTGFAALFAGAFKFAEFTTRAIKTIVETQISGINLVIKGINILISASIDRLNFLLSLANKIPGVNIGPLGTPEIGQASSGVVGEFLTGMAEDFKFMGDEMVDETSRLFNSIGDSFTNGFGSKALNFIESIQEGVIKTTESAIEEAKTITKEGINEVTKIIALTQNELFNVFTNEQIAKSLTTFTDKFSDGFAKILVSGKSFGSQLKALFGNILNDIVTQWLAAMIKMAIAKMLIGFGGGATTGFKGALTSAGTQLMPRRNGGPVMAGQSYLVGEAGEEMFTPKTSGYITPNKDLLSSELMPRRNGGPVMAGQSYLVGEAGQEMFTPKTSGYIKSNKDLLSSNMREPSVNYNIYAYDVQSVEQVIERNRPRLAQDALLAFSSAASRRKI